MYTYPVAGQIRFHSHGEYEAEVLGQVVYLKMTGTWNLEKFKASIPQFNRLKSEIQYKPFYQVTDLRGWEGATPEALDYERDQSKNEIRPQETVILVDSNLTRWMLEEKLRIKDLPIDIHLVRKSQEVLEHLERWTQLTNPYRSRWSILLAENPGHTTFSGLPRDLKSQSRESRS